MTVAASARGRTSRPLALQAWLGGAGSRVLSLIALVIIWEIGSRFADPLILPAPERVAESFWKQLVRGDLTFHTGMTLYRAAAAFSASMLIGTVIGIVLGRVPRANRFFDGWVVLGLNMPALVVGIMCYIWFGLTDFALILAVTINKVPLVAITVREGAAAIQPDLLQVAKAFRLRRLTVLRRVVLPQLYPYIMASSRAGLALIWKIVLVFELLGRSNGVGFQLSFYFQNFEVHNVLAYAFGFIAVVMLIEALIVRPLERRATRWRM